MLEFREENTFDAASPGGRIAVQVDPGQTISGRSSRGIRLLRHLSMLAALTSFAWSLCAAVIAEEVFVLENGGRVIGTLINVKRRASDDYQVALESGGEATLSANQVREVIRRRPIELEYEHIAPTFADTAEGQWEAAEWCRQRQLPAHRQHHLRRVIELNPSHTKAWAALGYTQINGQWKRPNDVREEEGYQRHQGRWRLSQEIEIVEQRQDAEAIAIDWSKKIAKWHQLTKTADRASAEAHQQLSEVRDPLAVPALIRCLVNDRRPVYRIFFLDVLDKVPSPAALDAIGRTTLLEQHPEVFHAAVDRIVRRKSPQLVEAYCRILEDPNNEIVNRAAYVLGRLEDRSATMPLIRALATNHVVWRKPPKSPQGMGISVSIPKDGSAPLIGPGQEEPSEPVAIPVRLFNQEVLTALTKVTGQDFGYDGEAWSRWYAAQAKENSPKVKPRED